MPSWPDQKRFAFTIFDDPDSQTLEAGREVYALLKDLGFRTTKGVWPVRGPREPSDHGITCDDAGCLPWLLDLQQAGFEIGLHNVTLHTSTREETIRGIERFEQLFGHQPLTMAQHYFCNENIYWGAQRVSGGRRLLYNLYSRLTQGGNRNRWRGHVEGDPLFWGDVCQAKVKYLRNFVFPDINTLKACPWMPYHDPQRPYVNYWYASSEGANVESFVRCLQEPNQERLEDEGGACIMYTHFGHGYYRDGRLDPRFRVLMERLAQRAGWFVPVRTLLDYLMEHGGGGTLTDLARAQLERHWMLHKMRYGAA
jgi:hypothetical protein